MTNDERLADAQFELQLELEDLTLEQVRARAVVFGDACRDLGIGMERQMVLTRVVWGALQEIHGDILASLPYLIVWCQGSGLPGTAVGAVAYREVGVFADAGLPCTAMH